jgi:hypothetical protein
VAVDLETIHPGAIGRVEIDDEMPGAVRDDAGVPPRDVVRVEADRAAGVPAEEDLLPERHAQPEELFTLDEDEARLSATLLFERRAAPRLL